MNDVTFQEYKKLMGILGLKITKEKSLTNGSTVYEFFGEGISQGKITTLGYDDFRSVALFDKGGLLVKASFDSHVAYDSTNAKELYSLFI